MAGVAAPDRPNRLELVLRLAVDIRMTSTALVVDRSRPPQCPRDLRARELKVRVPTLLDQIRDERLAVALGGCRRSLEIAAAPRVAVAELDVRSTQVPAHRSSFSVGVASARRRLARLSRQGALPVGTESPAGDTSAPAPG